MLLNNYMKDIKEMRQKTVKELEKEAKDLINEISKLRLEIKVNPPKDSNVFMKKRKRLAVVLTVLAEKKTDGKNTDW